MLVRLRYLREGQSVGFTLRELRGLLRLTLAGAPRFCETFDVAVNDKIRTIDQMVVRLLAQRARLEEFSRGCRQRRKERRCPIPSPAAKVILDVGWNVKAWKPLPRKSKIGGNGLLSANLDQSRSDMSVCP